MGLEEVDPTHGYLLHSPTAREEVATVMAMQGDVEHTGVLVEGVLGAIAMMNILWEMGGGSERWRPEQVGRVLRLVTSLRVRTLDGVRKLEFLEPN